MFIDAVRIDARHALRQWAGALGSTAVALLVLSVGIGANLAMFGLFDALVLRPLPVPDPHRLVSFVAVDPKHPDELSTTLPYSVLSEFERRQTVFTAVAAYDTGGVTVETDGVLAQAGVLFVSDHYFDVLEVGPQLGRLLTADDVKTTARVAVMTDGYWERRYSRDPKAIGTVVKLQGLPFTIVGIAARGFSGQNVDYVSAFVLPITTSKLLEHALGMAADDAIPLEYGLGRLRPGVRIEAARTQLEAFWPAIREASVPPKKTPDERQAFLALALQVSSAARGFSFMRDWWAGPLGLLVGATNWMLLIACVNLASLATARTIRRR